MFRLLSRGLVAFAVAGASLTATAADASVYREGAIEVTIATAPLPAAFRAPSGADDNWFGVSSLITRVEVKVDANHTIVPLRAFLGLTDPRDVAIRRSGRGPAWTLTISGGDAATSYRAVMEFDGVDVRTVKDYANEADRTHPYATQVFARPQVLD